MGEEAKIILCVASDSVSLCQVTNQRGEGYVLSGQVIRIEKKFENQENWLDDVLKKLDTKFLKKVEDVIFSTTLGFPLPLRIFCSRDSNFNRVVIFELENLMGNRTHQFKFWVYKMNEDYQAYAFQIQKTQFARFMKTFESVGIKNPRILLSPVMFCEAAKLQSIASCTAFLNVEYNVLSIVFKVERKSYSCLLPIDLEKLARKISTSINRQIGEGELRAFTEEMKKNNNPQVQAVWDEFFDYLCSSIREKAKTYFGENREVTFVIGGYGDDLFGITQRLQKTEKVFPYHLFFKQQISPIIDSEIVLALETSIPALLSTATLDKKRLEQIVNLKVNTSANKKEKQSHFFYDKCVTGLICIASILFYFSQKLNSQYVQQDDHNKQLFAKQTKMSHIAERIDALNKHIEQQKKSLENALVYIEQNRVWCTLLNALQEILSQAGDVCINSFTWNVQTAKEKQNLVTTKFTKTQKENKKTNQKSEKNQKASVLSSSIHMAGTMFVGNVEINERVKEDFNNKFNGMFDCIRQLPFCTKVTDIKINLPENAKIVFRCVIELDPKSKIIAL